MRPSSIVAFMLSSTLLFIGCYSERLFEGHSTGSPFHGTMQANKAVDIWPWSLNPLDGRGDGMAASVLPWLVAAQIGIALARRALVLLVQCVRKREARALLAAGVVVMLLLFVNVVPVAAATAAPFEVHSTATSRRVDGLAHAKEPRGNATAPHGGGHANGLPQRAAARRGGRSFASSDVECEHGGGGGSGK